MAMTPSVSERSASTIVRMLREDHRKVKDLFEEFETTEDSKEKQKLVETALAELQIHAKLEEEIIYPAIRPEIEEQDLMDEALEEHHVVHTLVAELKKMKPSSERYDAKFTVLGESVKHHIKEEEGQMLPKAEKCDIDWDDLTNQVMKRKEQLMARFFSRSGKRNGRVRHSQKNGARSRR